MDNTALILIVITNLSIVLILGALTFLIYKLLKQKSSTETSDNLAHEYHPAIKQRMKDLNKIKLTRSDLFCPNHPDEPGEVSCGICDRLFCKVCIKPYKNLHFCREHMPLIMNKEWVEVLTVKTSTQDPEEGVRLYDEKKRIFQDLDIPTFIETHYKINVDQDFIETYLVVFSLLDNFEKVNQEMNQFK